LDKPDQRDMAEQEGQKEHRGQERQPLQGLKILRVLGIDIYINYTWLIIFALVAWSLAAGYFPAALPGRSSLLYWGLGLAAAVLLFASVLVHELTHSVVAKSLGLHISGITLFLFGGVSNLTDAPPDPGSELKIAVSGPLSSLALSGLFYLFRVVVPGPPALSAILGYLFAVNLLLAIFNIIPGFPLDGGRLLRSLLWWKTHNLKRSTLMAASAGSGVGWALVAFGLLGVFAGNPLGGIWLVLIGLFLRSAANYSWTRAKQGQEV
jgi:Zn-dependent protease